MPRKAIMKIKKGDDTYHAFKLPLADYTAGGTLSFTAKPAVDNDVTDAAAVINKSFSDTEVSLDATYATWALHFGPSDIVGVNFSDGETAKEYVGEFQWVEADGTVHSYPDDDNYIQVTVYADVRRGVA